MIVVHVTHEAVEKIGGIGAVIAGLMTADAYRETVSRTILVGPLFRTDQPVNKRLGEGGKVIYSSLDAITPSPWKEKFRPIEKSYDVGIIYGTRKVHDPCTGREVESEVLLFDLFHANQKRLNLFKAELFKKFAVPSAEFEDAWEYEEYVRLAEPGFEALKALEAEGDPDEQVVLLGHEYMGMPLVLKAILDGARHMKSVFYAHEVASVRPIVEKCEGHDTSFYNILETCSENGRTVEDIFPQVFGNYKHALVKAARHCDHVFAVGDFVVEELKFLDKHFKNVDIDLVYNGIPADKITLKDKTTSRERMQDYAETLIGRRPDWICTHVCRPVLSKGLWRDLHVLHKMDPLLSKRGETAAYFLLGTMAGQRRPRDVRQMERVYGWPVGHEKGYPDLCQGEEDLGDMVDAFNAEHEAVRAVLVNQWDWNPEVCGRRMPEDMTFADIRRGTDVEFGLSIYEPYGISQFEPLAYGAVCIVSNVCGCVGFARRAADGKAYDNVIEGDFLDLPHPMGVEELKNLTIAQRDRIEATECERIAGQLMDVLPRNEETMKRLLADGYKIAGQMSWEHVMNDYFMPALDRTIQPK
ncbi:MAG: hypothetical protein ACLFVU_04510 [Phycisphaerae bacterium]